MPPITVEGKAPLFEEDLIGDYSQPRWTAHRRFGETRVYVIPKGQVEFEFWMRPTFQKDGEPTKWRSLYEMEFGLPGRFQLDLYAVGNKEGDGDFKIDTQQIEVRWALADWGSNFVWEQNTGEAKERSLEWTTGWSYSAVDHKVGVGLETQLAFVSELEAGVRGSSSKELLIGPSVQFRFLPQMHLDIAPLFGVSKAAPRAKVFVVFGWEL